MLTQKNFKIISEKKVYNGFFKMYEATIEETIGDGTAKTYTREKIKRPPVVAAFVYNKESETVVLVRQYRYAVDDSIKELLYEIPAGIVDEGETPLQAAKREIFEETGYKVRSKEIIECIPAFSTPGIVSEKVSFYIFTVINSDKKGKGGGDSNEAIEVVEIPYLIFLNNIEHLNDLKTRMLAYEAHYRKIFDKKP